MESAGPSNKSENEENSYLQKEAKKVRIYIGELRKRLAKLQTEGEEIEKTSETVFGDQRTDADDLPTVTAAASSECKIMPASPIGAAISEATEFSSLLRKFENMNNDTELPLREEPEEIRLLRIQNGSIRDRIKQIQSRIERAQTNVSPNSMIYPSRATSYEHETCSQLYEAATNTLKKVDAIEAEIVSVESMFRSKNSQNILQLTKDKK